MVFADMALINGKVFSPDGEGNVIRGDTVLVKDGKIMAVGSYDGAENAIGSDTRIIDCGGNTILPGLADAHCHPSISASARTGCDLFGIYIQEGEAEEDIIEKYLARLKTYIEKHPEEELIRGAGWVESNFHGDRRPTRHDLDRVCNDRPVILEAFSQHNLWVNTKAIEIAGVDENTPDVYVGKIYREESGYPEGMFNDPEAMDMIKTGVPGYDPSVEKYREEILYYQENEANRYGVTLVQDCMHSDNAREAYRQLAEEGKLTLRVRGVYLLEPGKGQEQLEEAIARKGRDDVGDDFRVDTVKMFAEGAFSLIEPYDRAFTEENGLPADYNEALYWDDGEFVSVAGKAMEAGFDVHVHAMGDNSVRQSVDCLVKAAGSADIKDRPPRNVIAHLMLVRDEDMDRMAENDIMGNCQPRWMVYDSDIEGMTPLMGEKRAGAAYPLRGFLDRGVRIAFGTDFPVTPPPDTMHEIQCAMTRAVFPEAPDYEKFKGKTLGSERPADLEEAVRSLSINGAYQIRAEKITGSIEEGKSADLVILDRDIENTDAGEIYTIKVEKTIFKGEIVYER